MRAIDHSRRFAPRPVRTRRIHLTWSDPVLRNLVWQIVIVGVVVAVAWFLISNTMRNLEARHVATGFAFLGRVAGIPLSETLLPYDPAVNTYGRALLVGVLNTLKVATIGIVLATILGTLIGIARLSRNWLLSHLAAAYVELMRDIPVLLQLLFWYLLLQNLPGPRQALHIGNMVFLSNRGIRFVLPAWQPAYAWAAAAFGIGLVVTLVWNRIAHHRQDATGVKPPVWPLALALLVGAPLAVWAAFGAPFVLDYPALKGFNFQGGGSVSPEYGALLTGLVIYTAAYIAENVRAGIQSVPSGQAEAAAALGLHRGMVLRLVTLPQALRVIIPPLTSDFLNLTKNSSLAVAIGFPDIVAVANTTLNQTGQAIEGIAIIMAVYLTISLSISAFMNWYNAHIALVER
jgi:general L-amino acid transport system permease protein